MVVRGVQLKQGNRLPKHYHILQGGGRFRSLSAEPEKEDSKETSGGLYTRAYPPKESVSSSLSRRSIGAAVPLLYMLQSSPIIDRLELVGNTAPTTRVKERGKGY